MSPLPKTPQEMLQLLITDKEPAVADFARCLSSFIATGDLVWIKQAPRLPYHHAIHEFGHLVAGSQWPWSEESRRIAEFAARHNQANGSGHDQLWSGVVRAALRQEVHGDPAPAAWLQERMIEWRYTAADFVSSIAWGTGRPPFAAWDKDNESHSVYAWERHILSLPDSDLLAALVQKSSWGVSFVAALAVERPEVLHAWLLQHRPTWTELCALVSGHVSFDPLAVAFVRSTAAPEDRCFVLNSLMKHRPDAHHALLLSMARDPVMASHYVLMERLCQSEPDLALSLMPTLIRGGHLQAHGMMQIFIYPVLCELAAAHLGGLGDAVFEAFIELPYARATEAACAALLASPSTDKTDQFISLLRRLVASAPSTESKVSVYQKLCDQRPAWFLAEWRELLGSSSKQLREIAAGAWAKVDPAEGRLLGLASLSAKRADQRLGAAAVLLACGEPSDVAAVQAALVTEKSAAVRAIFHEVLAKFNSSTPAASAASATVVAMTDTAATPTPTSSASPPPPTLAAWSAQIAALKRPPKLPATWLSLVALPALYAREGEVLSELPAPLVTHVLATQAGHKAMTLAPDLAAVWPLLDRTRAGAFALALLEAWLASPQDAKDRWALALVGLLGDTRVLTVLHRWIPKWCEAGRGKLAEYAAQALALQGSDEALMLLDGLATRFRQKQRNLGAAAAQAFLAAAEARGLSADELSDVVVPTFGFDAEGQRDFTWPGGTARAKLGVDLKLSWSDPVADKDLKNLPAAAPDDVKATVKELGKLLREAAKSQTARLELALVRQRRWPVQRWRELYEHHPVLRAFATRLVWGVYARTETGETWQRCFRRYPNGLLADAAGGLEELPEPAVWVGLVHPLELAADTLAAWTAHLARFKVQPPFPQLARPVERLDPLHANRRELAFAQGRTVGAGTFRARAERLGWQRGSVQDAGSVGSYYKAFPGAGVEVVLQMEGLFIGVSPMDTITLGAASFVRAASVRRGSYVYDDPRPGDDRVLAFGAVPAVVYSEAVGDLRAIAGLVATEASDAL